MHTLMRDGALYFAFIFTSHIVYTFTLILARVSGPVSIVIALIHSLTHLWAYSRSSKCYQRCEGYFSLQYLCLLTGDRHILAGYMRKSSYSQQKQGLILSRYHQICGNHDLQANALCPKSGRRRRRVGIVHSPLHIHKLWKRS